MASLDRPVTLTRRLLGLSNTSRGAIRTIQSVRFPPSWTALRMSPNSQNTVLTELSPVLVCPSLRPPRRQLGPLFGSPLPAAPSSPLGWTVQLLPLGLLGQTQSTIQKSTKVLFQRGRYPTVTRPGAEDYGRRAVPLHTRVNRTWPTVHRLSSFSPCWCLSSLPFSTFSPPSM